MLEKDAGAARVDTPVVGCRSGKTRRRAINKELYDALREAGASDDRASAAAATVEPAEELVTKADLEIATANLEADLRAWMLAQTLLLVAAMVGLKIFG